MESICDLCSFTPAIRHPPILRDQFRSGFIVSLDDLVRNTTIIAEEEQNIQRCLSKISRLQNILSDLEKEKKTLEEQVQQRRSYLSSLQRIPQELWIEIFSYCCVREERDRWSIPFKLSSVCYRWRDIVISTPAFWSTIVLNMHCKHQGSGLEFYLLRSAEHDLDLRIDDLAGCSLPSQIQEELEEEEAEEKLEEDDIENAKYRSSSLRMLLLDNMRRVRSLSIVQSYHTLPFPDHQPTGSLFQRLELLKVDRYNYFPDWFWDAVHKAPQLRKLVVNSGSLRSDVLSDVARPGSKLRSLEVSSALSGEIFLKAMRDLPSLEHLSIKRLYSLHDRPPVAKITPTTCHALRSLIIQGIDTSITILVLLQSLRLPNLDFLDINWLWTRGSSQDDALLTLSGIAPSLRKLLIRGIDLLAPLDKLSDILRALPDLVEFTLGAYSIPRYDEYLPALESGNSFIASLFSYLTHSVQTNSSRLNSISIHLLVEATEEMLNALLGMSEAWVIGNDVLASNLKYLHFSAHKFLHPDKDGLRSRLQALEGKGFEMEYDEVEKMETITIRYEA
ncbi:hypothetical protein PQX77_000822 [Marasmius sp. AFHP31]|nr:hypothetical protein PQX77_000822 [Marasmius sp. AFHP31]